MGLPGEGYYLQGPEFLNTHLCWRSEKWRQQTEHRREAITHLNSSKESGYHIRALLMRVFNDQWEGLQSKQSSVHPRRKQVPLNSTGGGSCFTAAVYLAHGAVQPPTWLFISISETSTCISPRTHTPHTDTPTFASKRGIKLNIVSDGLKTTS